MKNSKKIHKFIILVLVALIFYLAFLFFHQFIIHEEKQQIQEKIAVTEDAVVGFNVSQYIKEGTTKLYYSINGVEKETTISSEEAILNLVLKEGKNAIKIRMGDSTVIERELYYIKPYQHQFLEEFSTSGLNNKIDDLSLEEQTKSIDMMKSLGNKYVRVGIWWRSIEQNGQYNFEKYDTWFKAYENNQIEILAVLGFPGNLLRR